MLDVRGLRVQFGAVAAVDGVDLHVADGSVLALLGPSGCGKSTLLRAIAGLQPTQAGVVEWDGLDLARLPVHRRGFGLMFQDGVLFPHRTVAGNVRYGLRGRPDASSRVAELLDMVGLAGYGDRRVANLSGGEAQRVALARALAPRPRLLLLDEPLAALDQTLRATLLADLRAVLRRTETTAIFVTHDQHEAFAVADTVAVMRSGRFVQTGLPRDVWSHPADPWTARFLGCGTVMAADPQRDASGSWVSMTAFGPVPGRARHVGLRPAALVVDPAGGLVATVRAVIPDLDGPRLEVEMRDGPAAETSEFLAVAPASVPVEVGQRVSLRFDAQHAVPVGADAP